MAMEKRLQFFNNINNSNYNSSKNILFVQNRQGFGSVC